jgi:anti-sigma regulatory factor (Ser/Thr protein kinase)
VYPTLSVDAHLGRLADVRGFVRRTLAATGVEDGVVSDVVQAVDEAATNIIEHGYRGVSGTIEVEVVATAEEVTVHVRDGCLPFDPTVAPAPDTDAPLARRPLGGMGIHLARVLTDRMAHRILPAGGNELTLVKRLGPARGGQRDGDPG